MSTEKRGTKKRAQQTRKPKEKQREKPNWQPIGMLPGIAALIDGEVENFEDLCDSLCQAKEKPYVMDDETVDRAITNHQKYLEEAWVYEEQLARWGKEEITEGQRREVERLTGQMVKYQELCKAIVAVSKEIKKGTINRILEMEDGELGMAFLMGKIKLPGFETKK